MEGAGLLHLERAGNPKNVMDQKMPLSGSVLRRKTLSDITNTITNLGNPARSVTTEQVNVVPSASMKDYVAQLLMENTTLLRHLGERNKIIEVSGIELQKLRSTFQKAQQQNLQLAQANSQMLAELNLGKDRLKALQHELGCKKAVLRAKNFEIEEEKLKKQLHDKFGTKEGRTKCAEVTADASHPANNKKACNPSRKRALRSQSLGSTSVTDQVLLKEKDDSRRKSLRRRSSNLKSELCEHTEDVFKEEDVKCPIHSLISGSMHEDGRVQLDSSAHSKSNSITREVKDEEQKECGSSQCPNQELQRSLVGRPMRRAAEKVNCYKEMPINVKMRRSD